MVSFALLSTLLFSLIVSSNGMIEKFKHLKIGYEVRSIDQFKFDKGGTLEMTGFITITQNENDDDDDNGLTNSDITFIDVDTMIADDEGTNNNDIINNNDGDDDVDIQQPKNEEEEQQQETQKDEKEEQEEEADPQTIHLYHCTDSEIEKLNKYNSMNSLCSNLDSFSCTWSLEMSDSGDINYSFHSLKKQWMTMIIMSCNKHSMADIETLNIVSVSSKNGEYLSLSQINYKYIYLYLLSFYLFISIIWFIHLYRYKHFNISLQKLFLLYPLFQFILCIFSHFYWKYSSDNGYESNIYLVFCYIFNSICDAILALLFIFICSGYGFMKNTYTGNKNNSRIKIEIYAIFISIIISSIGQYYYASILLFTVMAYVLCSRRMLKSYTENVKLLESQIDILNNSIENKDDNYDISPAEIKLNMFKLFRKGILVYIGLRVLFYWTSSLLLYEYPWINDIILNALSITFLLYLFYIFRLKPFKPYFYLLDNNVSIWKPGNQLPKNISYNLSFHCDMVIVENVIDYIDKDDRQCYDDSDSDYDSDEEDEGNLIINYSLSRPFTIDLDINNPNDTIINTNNPNKNKINVDSHFSHNTNETTPLLSISTK